MALFGSGYDSIAQQKQFYDNLALRIAEQQRVAQQQQFENQMTQSRFGASMQEAARAAADRRRMQSAELGNEQMRNLANILMRQEQMGIDRSRIQQQDRAAQMRALMDREKMEQDLAGQEFELAQEALRGTFGAGQQIKPEELISQFPRLTPPMKAALGRTFQEFNNALQQNQRAKLGASSVLNQVSALEKMLSEKRRMNAGKKGGEGAALSAEITSINEMLANLNEQAKAIPSDVRAGLYADPTWGTVLPNQAVDPAVADQMEQWRYQAEARKPVLEAEIAALKKQFKPGSDEYTANVLPAIMQLNRIQAAVGAGPIPYSSRWNETANSQGKPPQSYKVKHRATGQVRILPINVIKSEPDWQQKFMIMGPGE